MTTEPHAKPAVSLFDSIPDGIEEEDLALFRRITSASLLPEQERQLLRPPKAYPEEETVLAVHWHPEFIPMELAARRIDTVFPNRSSDLIIPTQHNALTSFGEFTGVEVDCRSTSFNRKVELLLHFQNARVACAHSFKLMLEHTFRYRSIQLLHYLHAVTKPNEGILGSAVRNTGADETLLRFVRGYVRKLEKLIEETADLMPPERIKNKIVRDFFDGLRGRFPGNVIDRAQLLLASVGRAVKEEFPLDYFYRTSEIIEEARALGGCVVIPHPEKFWPVLLADYDVDGYEVWNPQSHTYTEFLISVVERRNRESGLSARPLLVFMGDDTHLSEKVRPPAEQDRKKADREIGLQPAWKDANIVSALALAGMDKRQIVEDYRQRLATG